MNVSDWLDEQEAQNIDVTQIELPKDISYDAAADETIFFAEDNPCGVLCAENHPFSKVERFGRWFYCSGQDKKAGIHSSQMKWRMFTKDKDRALQVAKEHME